MIHYTCDRCRRVIDNEEELRFEINIVTEIKLDDTPDGPGTLAREQLDEIVGLTDPDSDDDLFRTQRYDLCAGCYKEFARNPVSTEPQVQVEFSEN